MNGEKHSGLGRMVGTILTWAAALCLLACLLDWLLKRKWGLFVILASLWTIGSALVIALTLGMLFDMAGRGSLSASDAVVSGEWIASGICGVVLAAATLALEGGRSKTKIKQEQQERTGALAAQGQKRASRAVEHSGQHT